MSSVTPRSLTHDQYSIGIICPLGDELAAVEAMLDQIDTTLPTAIPGNAYTLGRIGDHNVVVAVLPRSGEASAAWAGANLLRNFPSIKFGLLVGIGGGVPGNDEAHDVRLGDVVVSYASGTFGGVVQYQFGKMRAGWKFERTGSIDSPPPGVTAQVNKLRARHIREGSQIPSYLEAMVKRYPRMASYSRPKNSPDRLFRASYTHVIENASCSNCENQYLIQRADRASDEPVVFYGVIGSGNQVVRNPELRDQLKEQYGIMCLDMEAAGLMHNFPCLVIRGISDYADSHKNDTYKRYAAATAAAYMKELLLIMPSQDVRHIPAAPKELQNTSVAMPASSNITAPKQPLETNKDTLEPSYKVPHEKQESRSLPFIGKDKPRHLNILVLGEVGVGKSNFINAFVNYLRHDSLDAALQKKYLGWVSPCSFEVQTWDPLRAGGSIVENKVILGGSVKEVNDTIRGQSATRRSSFYYIKDGSSTYHLIDTPGVGDARGPEFDERTLLDILDAINKVDAIHGIVILFKPNDARLTSRFLLCIKELLTHLHRNAAMNIVFGFTNTRYVDYTPGDTHNVLESLFAKHPEMKLSLNSESVYCVDSEGFRFLAAAHQGIQMSDQKFFDQSWQRSSEEMRRMVDHFSAIKPLSPKYTLMLNGMRIYIKRATEYIYFFVKNMKATPEALEENDKQQRADKSRSMRGHTTTATTKSTPESYWQEVVRDYNIIQVSAAELSVFLRADAIFPDDYASVSQIDGLIERERSWIATGASGHSQRIVNELKEAKEMQLRLIASSESTMKANRSSPVMSVEIMTEHEISRIKAELEGLKHLSSSFRNLQRD